MLLVGQGGELGGAEALLDAVVREVDRGRVTPVVACLGRGSWPERLAADGIEVHVFERQRFRHLFRVGRVVAGLTSVVRRGDIDLVHANGSSALLYASIAARLGRARLVWQLHDKQSRVGARRRLLLLALRMSAPDHLIFSNQAAADSWLRVWRRSPPAHSLILPDVDVQGIRAGDGDRARIALAIPPGVPVVALLARPEPHKGHPDLVRAIAIVRERVPQVRVVMGTGWDSVDFEADLRRLADDLGISDSVCLPGGIGPELRADLLAACTVLAHPSWIEPFGLAMLEAMIAGKPVVAATTDGSRYLVEPSVTGLLVPPRDPEKLASALLEILENPLLASAMGEAGRERAARISDGQMVKHTLGVWEATR